MGNLVTMPNTIDFQLGDLTLNLRLDGRSILEIEKRLDEGIMGLFLKKQGEFKMPPTNCMLIVLQGANKKSGVKEKDLVAAFEQYIDEGHTTMELFESIQNFLAESGFFGKDQKKEATNGESSKEEEEESLL